MDVFFTGLITLGLSMAVFYIVFFAFTYYWHLKKTSYVAVPIIFTFEIFVRCFLAVVIISIIFYYAPIIINSLGI